MLKTQIIYDCSLSVLKNAGTQPFKYLCKYFNIKEDEKTLEKFENVIALKVLKLLNKIK